MRQTVALASIVMLVAVVLSGWGYYGGPQRGYGGGDRDGWGDRGRGVHHR